MIFHSYVSLPEGTSPNEIHPIDMEVSKNWVIPKSSKVRRFFLLKPMVTWGTDHRPSHRLVDQSHNTRDGLRGRKKNTTTCICPMTGWWLSPTPLKNDGRIVSWMMKFPIWWESHKSPWFQTTNQTELLCKSPFSHGFPIKFQTTNQLYLRNFKR